MNHLQCIGHLFKRKWNKARGTRICSVEHTLLVDGRDGYAGRLCSMLSLGFFLNSPSICSMYLTHFFIELVLKTLYYTHKSEVRVKTQAVLWSNICLSFHSEERRVMGQGAAKSFKRKSMVEPRWGGQCWAWWAPEDRLAQDDTPWLVINIKWEDTLVSMQPPQVIVLPPPVSFFSDPVQSQNSSKIILEQFWLVFTSCTIFLSYLGMEI